MSKVVVMGASPNHERYSFKVVKALRKRNYEVVALGTKAGEIVGVPILTGQPEINDVDTVLLYLNPERQKKIYDYILSLKPRRIIFNPGTNNQEFAGLAQKNDIEVVNNCALIMLGADTF